MLDKVQMARSTFYYHIRRLSEPDKYAALREKIRDIFSHHEKRYGYRRVTYELLNNRDIVNHKTVQKLMSEMGLRAKVKKPSTSHTKVRLVKLHQMLLTETLSQLGLTRNGLQM